jgi:hypothetical protein
MLIIFRDIHTLHTYIYLLLLVEHVVLHTDLTLDSRLVLGH